MPSLGSVQGPAEVRGATLRIKTSGPQSCRAARGCGPFPSARLGPAIWSPSAEGPGGSGFPWQDSAHPPHRPLQHWCRCRHPPQPRPLSSLQAVVGRPRSLADPAAGKPSPRPRAWRRGTGRPPSPQCTRRGTAIAGRRSPTAYGRTGPHPQVGTGSGGQNGLGTWTKVHGCAW